MRQQVVDVLFTLVLVAALTTCASAAIGSFFRRTAPATVTAYLILTLLLLGPLGVWLGRDAPFGHNVVESALKLSPVAAAMRLIETPGFRDYEILPTAWWVVVVGILVAIALLCWRTWELRKPE